MTKVLALDISKRSTGWAADGADGRPRTGTWTGASEVLPGLGGKRYSQWLCSMIDTHKPELIAVEAPMMGGPGITMTTEVAYMLIGLAFLTETIADSYGLRFTKAHVQTIRAHFVGRGRPPSPKKVVMARCKLLGWDVANHDAADAAAVWCWAKSSFDPGFRVETGTPLFARTG